MVFTLSPRCTLSASFHENLILFFSSLLSEISEVLSDLERQVLDAFMDGKSYQEIAELLGRHVKSIDNALQRVKRKLSKFREENDS